MTRKSKREIERALEELGSTDQYDGPEEITIRHHRVAPDSAGDLDGQPHEDTECISERRIWRGDGGTWNSEFSRTDGRGGRMNRRPVRRRLINIRHLVENLICSSEALASLNRCGHRCEVRLLRRSSTTAERRIRVHENDRKGTGRTAVRSRTERPHHAAHDSNMYEFDEPLSDVILKSGASELEELRERLTEADNQQEVVEIVVEAIKNDDVTADEAIELCERLQPVGEDKERPEKDDPGELKAATKLSDLEEKAATEDVETLGDFMEVYPKKKSKSSNPTLGEVLEHAEKRN